MSLQVCTSNPSHFAREEQAAREWIEPPHNDGLLDILTLLIESFEADVEDVTSWLDVIESLPSDVDVTELLDMIEILASPELAYDILIALMRANVGLPSEYDSSFVVGTLQEMIEPTEREGLETSLVLDAIKSNPGASLSDVYSTVDAVLEPDEFASDVRFLASLGYFELVSSYGVEWMKAGDDASEQELSMPVYSDEVFVGTIY